jgi:hypothetical protein
MNAQAIAMFAAMTGVLAAGIATIARMKARRKGDVDR